MRIAVVSWIVIALLVVALPANAASSTAPIKLKAPVAKFNPLKGTISAVGGKVTSGKKNMKLRYVLQFVPFDQTGAACKTVQKPAGSIKLTAVPYSFRVRFAIGPAGSKRLAWGRWLTREPKGLGYSCARLSSVDNLPPQNEVCNWTPDNLGRTGTSVVTCGSGFAGQCAWAGPPAMQGLTITIPPLVCPDPPCSNDYYRIGEGPLHLFGQPEEVLLSDGVFCQKDPNTGEASAGLLVIQLGHMGTAPDGSSTIVPDCRVRLTSAAIQRFSVPPEWNNILQVQFDTSGPFVNGVFQHEEATASWQLHGSRSGCPDLKVPDINP